MNVNATDSKMTSSGNLLVGGAFGGNTESVNIDQPISKTLAPTISVTTEAKQEINPTVLGASDAPYGKAGANTLHEVTEAYQGAVRAEYSVRPENKPAVIIMTYP